MVATKKIHTTKPKKMGLKEIIKAVGKYDVGQLSHVFFCVDFFVHGRNKSQYIATMLQCSEDKAKKYLRKSLLNMFELYNGWYLYKNEDIHLRISYKEESNGDKCINGTSESE